MRDKLLHAGFKKNKVEILHHGVNVSEIEPCYRQDGYMLYVGRLVEAKGIETLLKAAEKLPNIQFYIVGSGPEKEKLHEIGHRLSNVKFLGFRSGEELKRLYEGALAVIVPSIWYEVFGLVTIEAMAMGKPVIASRTGALTEIVEHGNTGLLYTPGSSPELAGEIKRLYDNPDIARAMGERARRLAEKNFNHKDHIDQLISLYKRFV
jgi:glycosyltransferase involved in cell wall biosynthesis